MADDAAAPEGELSESTPEGDDAPRDEALRSRASDTEGDDAPRDEALRSRASDTELSTASPDETSESPTNADTEQKADTEETVTDADSADAVVDADDDDIDDAEDYTDAELAALAAAEAKPEISHVRVATIIGLVVVVALAGLVGWLGFRAYESQKAERQRELFLQVGRQGALNLTTIDFAEADADVQRILDSATDTFYDDFAKRSQPFVDVVKQAQSKSVGTITSAGLESEEGDRGQVLVAVTVKTSNAGAAEQQPRAWRMRILVKKVGDDEAKVSNVEFVP